MATGVADDGPVFSACTRLLVIAPHPDDETIATGLLIQQVRAAGGEVRIVLLTAGENNPWPQRWLERRWRIRAGDRQRWGRRRRGELQQALASLEILPSALEALDWPDLGVTDMLLRQTGNAVATIREAINRFTPDVVALPALQDRHPDHGAAHVLVRLALAGHAAPPALFAYLVHGKAGSGDLIQMDGAPAQVSNKRAALQAHRSQIALSGKRLRQLAERPERFVDSRRAPPFGLAGLPWRPSWWLRPWLRLDVIGAAGAYGWAWPDAPLQRAKDGRFRLLPGAGEFAAPCFARLSLSLRSVWIFDHWGWCELQSCEGSSLPPVA